MPFTSKAVPIYIPLPATCDVCRRPKVAMNSHQISQYKLYSLCFPLLLLLRDNQADTTKKSIRCIHHPKCTTTAQRCVKPPPRQRYLSRPVPLPEAHSINHS